MANPARDCFEPTSRTQLKRAPDRGRYDRETIDRILDQGFLCHVGFIDRGQPFVIPTLQVRVGEQIYLHGSPGSRMLRCVGKGEPVCVTVTLVDGLVLARSAFHHSVNYRSVVILGKGRKVEDRDEKLRILHRLSEAIVPGRWDEVRRPSTDELDGTRVVALDLSEASAKVRTGPPKDDEPDYELPVWAGELPLRVHAEVPISDPRLPAGTHVPAYLLNWESFRRTRSE